MSDGSVEVILKGWESFWSFVQCSFSKTKKALDIQEMFYWFWESY